MKQLHFDGGFTEFLLMNIALTFITIFSLGIGYFFQLYWNVRWFIIHTQIQD